MNESLNILILEDCKDDADLMARFLSKNLTFAFTYKVICDEISFRNELDNNIYDIVISDHSMPGFCGIEAFRILKSKFSNIPFIMVTGTVSEKLLAELSTEGIDDYIIKDNLMRLPTSINSVISKKKMEYLHSELKKSHLILKQDIEAAKYIQKSVLPDPRTLPTIFPQSFVLFQPKDIVSGDFYYYKKIKNICYIVIADCTGHGIPGAFISMLGLERLSCILSENKRTDVILTELNDYIKNIFSLDTHSGMDAAICAIDMKTNILTFTGANRPLWIIRKESNEIEEIKGNKLGIGYSLSIDKEFSINETKLEEGDIVYLFTDGISDQFGGPNGKKLSPNKLKEILLNIKHLDMENQKEYISEFINEWKSNW